MPWCSSPAVELFYHDRGQGVPLVFLNGLSGDHLYWMGQVRFFARRYHCLALDGRDVGQTRNPESPYTVQDLAGDVLAVLDQNSVAKAHFVGLSMGGMVAQE